MLVEDVGNSVVGENVGIGVVGENEGAFTIGDDVGVDVPLPRHTTQCAAVNTALGLISVPPQTKSRASSKNPSPSATR